MFVKEQVIHGDIIYYLEINSSFRSVLKMFIRKYNDSFLFPDPSEST